MASERETGVVKWFNADKGYGFIGRGGGKKDLFVHYSSIIAPEGVYRTLAEGDEVSFEVENGPKGTQAINVNKA